MGRDLLTKLGAQIIFAPGSLQAHPGEPSALMMAVTMPREDEWDLCSSEREQINPTSLLEEFPAF